LPVGGSTKIAVQRDALVTTRVKELLKVKSVL